MLSIETPLIESCHIGCTMRIFEHDFKLYSFHDRVEKQQLCIP
jgi:hypothetical protein